MFDNKKFVIALIVFAVAVAGFFVHAFVLGDASSGDVLDVVESTDSGGYVPPVVPDTVPTTTTTIDLGWINTTTTTVYVAPVVVPEVEDIPVVADNFAQGDSVWDDLAYCEAGGNWAINTGNGFGGGLQFMHQKSYSTWLSFGGGDFASAPWEASREQQIVVAERILASSGWGAWPGCTRKLGLR